MRVRNRDKSLLWLIIFLLAGMFGGVWISLSAARDRESGQTKGTSWWIKIHDYVKWAFLLCLIPGIGTPACIVLVGISIVGWFTDIVDYVMRKFNWVPGEPDNPDA